jgi:hypothetical protein
MSQSHRLARHTAVAFATLVAIAALAFVYMSQDAQAYCTTNGGEYIHAGWGEEGPQSGECANNGVYNGYVADLAADSSCVWVQFLDGGTTYTEAQACSSTPVNFAFTDKTGDSSSSIRICRLSGCTSWQATTSY